MARTQSDPKISLRIWCQSSAVPGKQNDRLLPSADRQACKRLRLQVLTSCQHVAKSRDVCAELLYGATTPTRSRA